LASNATCKARCSLPKFTVFASVAGKTAPISVPLIDTVRVCVEGIKDTLIAGEPRL
jgi:hypothetical protein